MIFSLFGAEISSGCTNLSETHSRNSFKIALQLDALKPGNNGATVFCATCEADNGVSTCAAIFRHTRGTYVGPPETPLCPHAPYFKDVRDDNGIAHAHRDHCRNWPRLIG